MFCDFYESFKKASEHLPESFRTEENAEKLYIHLSELSEKGKLFNLTAICDPDEALHKHIIDSLYAASSVHSLANGEEKTLLDIGSGGGFPALPIACVCANIRVSALDATAKKCAFIAETAEKCGVSIETIPERAEDAVSVLRESFDFVTARAVARLNILAELSAPFLKVGGYFAAMKGQSASEEEREAEKAASELGLEICDRSYYEIKDGGTRCILIYKKVRETPAKYPRNYSQIKKKPL